MERSETELGDPFVRLLPVALGLLYLGNQAAIVSLGLIGSGTNNARIAGMLRNLSNYYYKEAGHLFCVRIAQGLVHMGKGLMTLSPYHPEEISFVIHNTCWFSNCEVCLSGYETHHYGEVPLHAIPCACYAGLKLPFLNFGIKLYLFYELQVKQVRIGQAVDVVDQAGRPKTITGFQTHSTPVLLASGHRAELVTEKICHSKRTP